MPIEDILGITIGIPGALMFTALIIRYKLKKKELEMRRSDPELGRVVEALCDDLDDTRAQVADMQERLDLAERLLSAGRESHEDRSG